MCAQPWRIHGVEYGCGKCEPCGFNRRRVWTLRLVLESTQHQASCFVTLTYDEEHVPDDGSVSVRELQLFVKRVRQRVAPKVIRYFGVGEYGDRSWRPHYHLALFGVSEAAVVRGAWTSGFVDVGALTPESAAYIAGYTVKRMTNAKDPRLGGRGPEFARMSLRPGIGAGAMGSVSDGVTTRGGAGFVARNGDVPGALRFGGKTWPLGRYLKGKLRECVGMDPHTPLAVIQKQAADNYVAWLESGDSSKVFSERREGKRLQVQRRSRWREEFNISKRRL